MSDIVVSGVKKVNLLDKIIQSVVIMVNINKMNRAIDEHLVVIKDTERDDQKKYQQNILREIVYVKYQYDIMQRTMYELKLSYPNEIIDNINSIVETFKEEFPKIQSIKIVEDNSVSPDGVIVETLSSRLDSRISTQISEIAQKMLTGANDELE